MEKNGIELLLKAEDEAAAIVQKAREKRVQRLRQAQEEAEKTIRELKAAHKAQFDREIAAKDEGDQGFFADLKSRQSAEQAGIEKGFDKNKEQVINFLLKEVTTVSLEVSEALRQSLLTKAEQGTQ